MTPETIYELEGDLEVNFFCRENTNSFATNIVWQDPQRIMYIPGSMSMGGNSRISAEGSRLQIAQVFRNDSGIYRCLRPNNPEDFAEGTLLVHGNLHGVYASVVMHLEEAILLYLRNYEFIGVMTLSHYSSGLLIFLS